MEDIRKEFLLNTMDLKFFLFSISLTLFVLFTSNINIDHNVRNIITADLNDNTVSKTYHPENDLKNRNDDIDNNKPCYILTPNTMEFHIIDCKTLDNLKSYEWKEYLGNNADLMNHGYRPCSICDPFSRSLPKKDPQPEYSKLKY